MIEPKPPDKLEEKEEENETDEEDKQKQNEIKDMHKVDHHDQLPTPIPLE